MPRIDENARDEHFWHPIAKRYALAREVRELSPRAKPCRSELARDLLIWRKAGTLSGRNRSNG